MKLGDSLVNLVAQLGTGKSKAARDKFVFRDMGAEELSAIYRGDWMGRKIVDAPVFDMFREWRAWQAEPAEIAAIEDQERRFDISGVVSRAVQFARLYGGGLVLIGADVSRPDQPLGPAGFGRNGIKYITPLSRHDVHTPEIDKDLNSPTFGQPKFYEISSSDVGTIRVHPSRVLRFLGSDRLEPRSIGISDAWGDSILASIYDAVHHAALSQASIADLVHEAKVDVISIKNLGSSLMTPTGTDQLYKRFTAANELKSINNMLLLDEGEKWERKQTSFTGLPDVLDRYLQIVSGACDIPATRLLGQAPRGMSSTGESDLRNYYDMIAAQRKIVVDPQMARLDRMLWVNAFGRIPADAYPEWRPLWQLTEKEKADIAKTKAETTQIYLNGAVIDENALRQGVENQLIEDGVYPGLEAAIAEHVQSVRAGQEQTPEAENDNPEADRSLGNARNRLPRRA